MAERILITGGAGFIGCNLVRYILKNKPDWQVVNFDVLTYAGNLESLKDVESSHNYSFVKGDVTDRDSVINAMKGCTSVMHLAAESHVDRSILDPGPFLRTNVIGTQVLLDAARHHKIDKFIQVSTDEVYGSLGPDDSAFTEMNHLDPSSPYSSSKAAADLLALSYHHTFDLPVTVTRCSNNFGPYQFPEKLLPLLIRNAMKEDKIPVYGDGMQVRDWIYVEDHCAALIAVFESGTPGSVYNIGGNNEIANLNLIKIVLKLMNKSEDLISFVKDRPGHDRRYAMDNTKITAELGWQPRFNFEEMLNRTIEWYLNNPTWIESVLTGEYRNYYQKQYGSIDK